LRSRLEKVLRGTRAVFVRYSGSRVAAPHATTLKSM